MPDMTPPDRRKHDCAQGRPTERRHTTCWQSIPGLRGKTCLPVPLACNQEPEAWDEPTQVWERRA
jgi:hypothetical protein